MMKAKKMVHDSSNSYRNGNSHQPQQQQQQQDNSEYVWGVTSSHIILCVSCGGIFGLFSLLVIGHAPFWPAFLSFLLLVSMVTQFVFVQQQSKQYKNNVNDVWLEVPIPVCISQSLPVLVSILASHSSTKSASLSSSSSHGGKTAARRAVLKKLDSSTHSRDSVRSKDSISKKSPAANTLSSYFDNNNKQQTKQQTQDAELIQTQTETIAELTLRLQQLEQSKQTWQQTTTEHTIFEDLQLDRLIKGLEEDQNDNSSHNEQDDDDEEEEHHHQKNKSKKEELLVVLQALTKANLKITQLAAQSQEKDTFMETLTRELQATQAMVDDQRETIQVLQNLSITSPATEDTDDTNDNDGTKNNNKHLSRQDRILLKTSNDLQQSKVTIGELQKKIQQLHYQLTDYQFKVEKAGQGLEHCTKELQKANQTISQLNETNAQLEMDVLTHKTDFEAALSLIHTLQQQQQQNKGEEEEGEHSEKSGQEYDDDDDDHHNDPPSLEETVLEEDEDHEHEEEHEE